MSLFLTCFGAGSPQGPPPRGRPSLGLLATGRSGFAQRRTRGIDPVPELAVDAPPPPWALDVEVALVVVDDEPERLQRVSRDRVSDNLVVAVIVGVVVVLCAQQREPRVQRMAEFVGEDPPRTAPGHP